MRSLKRKHLNFKISFGGIFDAAEKVYAMFDILYFFLLGIFFLFTGRYYYNNAYEIYTNE